MTAMRLADIPTPLVDEAEHALAEAATGDPETEPPLRDAIRIILAAVLPLHTRQLSLQVAHFTGTCSHHPKVSDSDPACMPCQRRTALIGARRLIEGKLGKPAAYADLAREADDGTG